VDLLIERHGKKKQIKVHFDRRHEKY